MAKYCCLLVYLIFVVDIGSSEVHKALTKSLHIAEHLRDRYSWEKAVKYTVEANINEDDIPTFLTKSLQNLKHSRTRRAVPTAGTRQPNSTTYAFQDSHTQMIIHWAGEDSDVIIALTKGVSVGHSGEKSSNVFVSHNYGQTFTSIKDKFTLRSNQPAVISQYYNNPILNSHYMFADETNKVIFTTTNYGSDVYRYYVEFTPTVIKFHHTKYNYALAMDKWEISSQMLYLTNDFGVTWRELKRGVKEFYWEHSHYGKNASCIYVLRSSTPEWGTVIRSCDFFRTEEVLINMVHDFEMQGPYMFATKRLHLLGGTGYSHQIHVSYYRREFHNSMFPHGLQHLDYYVADASEDQIFLCIGHDSRTSHLYISDVNGTKFSQSLENILYFNPNGSHGDSWLKYYMDEPFADLHKVQGMRGVYIATQLIANTLSSDHQRTLITYDKGGEWQLVVAPAINLKGEHTNCSVAADAYTVSQRTNCSLHLTQKYNRLYAGSRTSPILSRDSAPGIIIATGNTGDRIHVDNTVGIFVSTDAGFSWHQVLQGIHFFGIADHGGVIVAVKGNTPTNQIVYSTDEGKSWSAYNFTLNPIRIHGLLTEPGESTTVLFLFGSNTDHHSWKVISLDMFNVFRYKCDSTDYKMWSLPDNTPLQGCLLGRKVEFERRSPHADCYNGRDYDRKITVRNCTCTREDFECDFGYAPSRLFGSTVCRLADGMSADDVHVMPRNCPEGTFYRYSRGYAKISGDTCHGGDEHRFTPLLYACRTRSQRDFLLYSGMSEIRRLLLEGYQSDISLVPNQRWVSALDYEYRGDSGCIYWADDYQHTIQRLCEGGNTSITTLHNTSIGRVSGIAFEWKSRNIYWIDAQFKVIEVSTYDGRYRRQLIKNTRQDQHLDSPVYLAVDPYHGYMYWTEVSSRNPRIMRAWLDGTHIQVLVNGTLVHSPGGIVVDYVNEKLFWTDAGSRVEGIMMANTNGTNVRKLLSVQHAHRLALYKTYIYFDDISLSTIRRVFYNGRGSVGRVETVRRNHNVRDMKILDKTSQSGGNKACDGGGCTQLCLLKPAIVHGNNRTCRCAENSTMAVLAVGGDEQCNGTNHNGTCDSKDQFTCTNGKCISRLWKCDRDNDCGDNSDELDCPYHECDEGQFRCGDDRCIPGSWRCDFDHDCTDASDEWNCTYPSCGSDKFRCTNGRCIRNTWVCDFDNDCSDGSDEANCTFSGNITECEEGEVQCPTGYRDCILPSEVCDGTPNCNDGFDERNCTHNATTCPSWKRPCNNGNCVYRTWFCDGDNDCGDHSDEVGCTTTTRSPSSTEPSLCHLDWGHFMCDNGKCVWSYTHCDGVDDCGDNSDEQNCGIDGNTTCAPYEFGCNNGRCISMYRKCNGRNDCFDNSDEESCHWSTTARPGCGANQFRCYNSSDQRCIWMASVCDNHQDCRNNEDESHCGQSVTCDTDTHFKCEQSQGCILRKEICDGSNNCVDGSDEASCNGTVLPYSNITCTNKGMFRCYHGNKCIPYMLTCDNHQDCVSNSDENLLQCNDWQPHDYLVSAKPVLSTSFTVTWTRYIQNLFGGPSQTGGSKYILSYFTYQHSSYGVKNITVVNATSRVVTGLQPAHLYYVTVYAVRSGNMLPLKYQVIKVKTKDGIPDGPAHIHARSDDQDNFITVSWSPPTVHKGQIVFYRVFIKIKSSKSTKRIHYEDTDGEKYMMKLDHEAMDLPLTVNTQYTVWVQSFTSEGAGGNSTKMDVTYGLHVISYVGDLAGVVTPHSIKLSWSAPKKDADRITSYEVEYWDLFNAPHILEVKETHVEIKNLCSSSYYGFTVKAKNKLVSGHAISISLKTNGTRVEDPANITLDKIGPTTFKISWSLPKGADPKETFTVYYDYRPEVMYPSKVQSQAQNVTTANRYAIISRLQACDAYTFRLAVTGSGLCSLTPGVMGQTGSDSLAPPENLVFTQKNRTMGVLNWTASCEDDQVATGYVVYMYSADSKTTKMSKPYTNTKLTQLSLPIYNLVPGANYTFHVKNTYLGSRNSDNLTVVIDKYDGPVGLKAISTGSGGSRLYWVPAPDYPTKTFTGYEVMICSQPIGSAECEGRDEEGYEHYAFTKKMTYQVTSLGSGMEHFFRVRFTTKGGHPSSMSNIGVIEVEAVPSAQQSVMLSKSNLIAICVSVVAVIIALGVIIACFAIRHRRLQRSFHAFASSHYDSRSGTTTISAADELDEEEDTPMIRGFSDDEPLVIA